MKTTKKRAATTITTKGFTLIELLIVIAVLGVLAGVVLVAINPLEQLARGRDSGRKTAVGQLSHAMQAYYTAQNASYPSSNNTWITTLVNAGELKNEPPGVVYVGSGACTNLVQSNYCYRLNAGATEGVVYTRLESKSEATKCTGTSTAWFLWSSQDSQAGVVCTGSSDPTLTSGFTYK